MCKSRSGGCGHSNAPTDQPRKPWRYNDSPPARTFLVANLFLRQGAKEMATSETVTSGDIADPDYSQYGDGKVFTQADVNRIIQDRLKRDRDKHGGQYRTL